MSLLDLPREVLLTWWAVVGCFVGSFLNVVVYRYPLEGVTPANPKRSRCPECGHQLRWFENLPLASWLAQRGRCRACGWRIPWRYPLVEALTGGLWLWVAWATPADALPLLLVRLLVVSALIVATFVDFDCFEIPDSVSIGGMVAAPILSFLVPALHADSTLALALGDGEVVTRVGTLSASLAGLALGGGVLLGIGWLGERVFGREAMGLGDVKLLAAGGGFIGPGGVVLALMLASLLASLAGVANMARFFVLVRHRARVRGARRPLGSSIRVARIAGRYLPFGPYLAVGIGIALLYWKDVVARLI